SARKNPLAVRRGCIQCVGRSAAAAAAAAAAALGGAVVVGGPEHAPLQHEPAASPPALLPLSRHGQDSPAHLPVLIVLSRLLCVLVQERRNSGMRAFRLVPSWHGTPAPGFLFRDLRCCFHQSLLGK